METENTFDYFTRHAIFCNYRCDYQVRLISTEQYEF